MAVSKRLGITLMASNALNKELLFNEAVVVLDAMSNPVAVSITTAAPPAAPATGATYIVPASGALGAWAGQENKIAVYFGGWRFVTPYRGLYVFVTDENTTFRYNGVSGWAVNALEISSLSSIPDVSITSASKVDGALLYWDADTESYRLRPNNLAYLSDIDATGISDGQVLAWDTPSAKFVPASFPTELPAYAVGEAGRHLRVDAAGALEWAIPPTELPASSAPLAGRVLRVSSLGAPEWATVPLLPAYAEAHALRVLRVNSDGSGLVWSTISEGASLPAYSAPLAGYMLAVNAAGSGLEWVAAPSPGTTLPDTSGASVGQVLKIGAGGALAWADDATASGSVTELPAYSGTDDGKVLKVTLVGGVPSVVWGTDNTASGSTTELPAYTAADSGKVLKVDGSGALLWDADLTGTALPATSGQASRFLRVRSDEAGVEWAQGGITAVASPGDANYTLSLSHLGALVRIASTVARSVFVPSDSEVAFPVGSTITVRQAGAGQLTVVANAGVTVTTSETLKLRKAHSTVTLIKVAANTWDLTGDLELSA